jgi:hypothetical protein
LTLRFLARYIWNKLLFSNDVTVLNLNHWCHLMRLPINKNASVQPSPLSSLSQRCTGAFDFFISCHCHLDYQHTSWFQSKVDTSLSTGVLSHFFPFICTIWITDILNWLSVFPYEIFIGSPHTYTQFFYLPWIAIKFCIINTPQTWLLY